MFLGTEPAAGVEGSAAFLNLHELSELMQALPGFLMLVTGEGKLLYLSDSVSEHLGHSMVSPNGTNLFAITRRFHRLWETRIFDSLFQVDLVAQGDSVYDIIDASDHLITRTNLSTSTTLETGKTECRPQI